jgi:hypothetical protein
LLVFNGFDGSGENQKARFYPLSPATVGSSSTVGRCDCPLGRPRGLIAFELYPFTPGENQKARFYPTSHAENTEKENTES